MKLLLFRDEPCEIHLLTLLFLIVFHFVFYNWNFMHFIFNNINSKTIAQLRKVNEWKCLPTSTHSPTGLYKNSLSFRFSLDASRRSCDSDHCQNNSSVSGLRDAQSLLRQRLCKFTRDATNVEHSISDSELLKVLTDFSWNVIARFWQWLRNRAEVCEQCVFSEYEIREKVFTFM